MKTFYKNQLLLLKILKIPSLVFLWIFFIALTFNAAAQTSTPANPICYGTSFQLDCTGQAGCGSTEAPLPTYHWTSLTYPGTVDYYTRNPIIGPSDINGYRSQTFNLAIQYTEGGVTKFSAGAVAVVIANQIVIAETVTQPTCNGGSNGSISIAVSGGFPLFPGPPYYYFSWSPGGQTTQNISSLTAGIYTVLVTDGNTPPCTQSKQIVVGQPGVITPTLNAPVTNVSCNGGTNGVIDATATGGTAPYTYLWSPGGQTTNIISNLGAGTYTVQVTDAHACTGSNSWNITEPTGMTLSGTPTNTTCYNGNDGQVNISISGGATPYTFSWTGGATTQNITGKSPGVYCVTVSDNNACTKTGCWTVSQPNQILPNATVTDVKCRGESTGSIVLAPTGGTSPYTYIWNTNATSKDLINISAAVYSVTVTDNVGCTNTGSWDITQPESGLNVSGTPTQITCYGAQNGTITLVVTGGTTPYTYLWAGGMTTQNLTGLSPNTYTVLVTDNGGCTKTGSWQITQPASLPGYDATVHNVTCYHAGDGYITTTPNGGTPPYTFLWGGGQTTQDISALGPGSYNLTVTDANGCHSNSSSRDLTEPPLLVLSLVNKVNVNCFGGSTGSIDISVGGGTVPYTYRWSNNTTEQDLENISAGTYCVTVTDNHGCPAYNCWDITQPQAALNVTATVTQITCYGASNGTITLSVTGGTNPYTYLWAGGMTTENLTGLSPNTYTVQVTDNKGCTKTGSWQITQPGSLPGYDATVHNVTCYHAGDGYITTTPNGGTPPYTFLWGGGQTTQDISALGPGSYNLTVTDANGCHSNSSSRDLTEPPLLVLSLVNKVNVNCFGGSTGSIDISVGGGTVPYTYRWSNNTTEQDLENISAGTYCVTVTDNHGCPAYNCWDITQPQAALNVTATVTQITCYGASNGTITLSVTGGTNPYTYLWAGGMTTENLTGLSPNTYTVQVTDNKGCTKTGSWQITQPGSLPGYDATVHNVTCYHAGDGYITTTPNGGTPPYTFLWGGGQTTQDISALGPGSYNLTVTDANGCHSNSSSRDLTEPPLLVLSLVNKVDINCFGGSTGSIDISVGGGTVPYTYRWSNNETEQDLDNISAGTYCVTVTDNHGCPAYNCWTLTQPEAALNVIGEVTQITCYGASNGTITLVVTGGTTPYTYLWAGGMTTQNLTGLSPNTYTVQVTDNKGCTKTGSWQITQPGSLPGYDATVHNVTCFGAHDGYITTTPNGGTPPYTFLWGDGQTTQDITGLGPGHYNLTVTDANGCHSNSSSRDLTEPALLTANIANKTDISCYGYINGAIDLSVGGGTVPYTYLWNNNATTQDLINLPGGNYAVTVTDLHGCTAFTGTTITQPDPWYVTIAGCSTPCCGIGNSYAYAASVTGVFTAPVSYLWTVVGGTITSGQNTPSITVTWDCCNQGTVRVRVTESGVYNCTLETVKTVTVFTQPAPVITGPVSVFANQVGVVYSTPNFTGHTYNWTVVGGTITAGQGTDSITVTWGSYPVCGCGSVTVCETNNTTGCSGCATMNITMLPDAQNLDGYVYYKNGYNTGLNDVTVKLRDPSTGTIVATTTTGPNMNPPDYNGNPGYFAFTNVAAGTYQLEASFSGTWGGNNATDALLVQLYVAAPGTYPLTGLNKTAADVNASLTWTGLDALYIKLRTVGAITSYPAGDWVFDNPGVTVPGSGTVSQPIMGLCVGDVNGTYIPTGMKAVSFLSVVNDGVQTIPVNERFIYNIRSNQVADLGAMTLFMGYDANRFEIESVNTSLEGMKYLINEGAIALAWSDTKPLSVKNNDPILSLTMTAKEPLASATQIFNVLPGSEFANIIAQRYDNFDLKMADVLTPNGNKEFSMFNYPNPFNNTTNIVYTLPESGKVRLVLTDMYGKTIRVLVNNEMQKAGSYTVKVNNTENNLVPGVYLYKIEVEGATDTYVKVNKMLFSM